MRASPMHQGVGQRKLACQIDRVENGKEKKQMKCNSLLLPSGLHNFQVSAINGGCGYGCMTPVIQVRFYKCILYTYFYKLQVQICRKS
jgi:hypothetical protein